MFKKYTIIALVMLTLYEQVNGMSYLKRFGAAIGATVSTYSAYTITKCTPNSQPTNDTMFDNIKGKKFTGEFRNLKDVILNCENNIILDWVANNSPYYENYEESLKAHPEIYQQRCRPYFEKFASQANKPDKRGVLPIFYAVSNQKTPLVTQELIAIGATANTIGGNYFGGPKHSPLHIVQDAETARMLIKAGAPIEAKDGWGKTALEKSLHAAKKAEDSYYAPKFKEAATAIIENTNFKKCSRRMFSREVNKANKSSDEIYQLLQAGREICE